MHFISIPTTNGCARKARVNGDIRLGALGNPSCLGSVGREDLIKDVGQQGRPPVGVGRWRGGR
jgi:hypothetical protein